MTRLLVLSIVIRILVNVWAAGWSLWVLSRLRDWRIAFLTALIGLMTFREILTLLGKTEEGVLSIVSGAGEHPGIVLSIAVFIVIPFIAKVFTDRMQVEDSLRKSEKRFRTLAETASDAIITIEESGRISFVNSAAEKVFGYSQREMLGAELTTLMPEYLRHIHLAGFARYQETANRHISWETIALSGLHKNGNEVPLEISFGEFTQGDRRFFTGIARDITDRKRGEDALSKIQQQLQHVLSMSPAAIYLLRIQSEHFTPEWVSESITRLTGYEQSEALSKTWWADHLHPDDRERALASLRLVFTDDRLVFEYRFEHKQGGYLWIHDEMRLLRDGSGKPVEVIGSWIDVTERREAEVALRDSEGRFRTLVNSMDDIVATVDRQHRYSAFFGRWIEKAGLKPEAFAGRTASEILGKRDGLVHEEAIKRGLSGEQVVFEWTSSIAHRTSYFQTCLSPICDRSGEVTGLVAVARDITERKRAEDELRKQKEILQKIFDHIPAMIAFIGAGGRIKLVNPELERTLGWSQEEIERNSVDIFAEFYPDPKYRQAVLNFIVTADGEWADFKTRIRDGRVIDTSWANIHLSDGTTIGIGQDITERKRAENALRASEERYRDLVENARDIIYSHDLKGNYTSVNKAVEQITGYTREEALKLTFAQAVAPEYVQVVRQMIAAKLSGQEETVYDLEILTKDGRRLTVEVNTRLILQDDVPVGIHGIARDVTERKRAQEALRDSEERFRHFFELGLIGMVIASPSKAFIEVNDKMCEIMGYQRTEMLLLTWAELTYPDDLDANMSLFNRVLAGELDSYLLDKRFIRKDGGVIHGRISVSCVRRVDRSVDYFIALVEDVTERKLAEEALRESRLQLQAILDNCPAMIFQKDLDGRYLQVNLQFERTFNLTIQQVIGRTDDELFPRELAAAFRATDHSVREAGHSLEFEESALYADSLHSYIVHKFPLLDADGRVYAVGGISTDITARKHADDDLRTQKEILQKIFDHIPVMIRFLDEHGRVKLVNREWERTLGWTMDEIASRDVDIFAELYPDREYRRNVLNFIAASTGQFTDFKTRTKDGREIDTTFANVLLEDGTNIGIGRDITQRKRADQTLERQAAQLAALHEIELEISAESDLPRILDVVTRRAAELLDASTCSTYIRDHDDAALRIVASLDSKFVGLRLKEGEGLAGRALATGEAQAVDDYSEWPGRATAFDGESFSAAIAAPLKWQQTVIGALSLSRKPGDKPFTAEDLRLLKQFAAEAAIAIHQATLFDEVQESQRRLQVLSRRLIDTQEAERKRLSRELHDQIGQALTAVQISLQILKSSSEGLPASLVDVCLTITDDAIQQVHDLSLDLRPSLLDDLGLVAALRWYVDRVARLAGLVTHFEGEELETRLAPEIETACFRIAQEALTNVLRHSHAATVRVQISQRDSALQLLVLDDGVGFDVRAAMSRTGVNASLGLQGMQERAAALGGIVHIRSNGGNGVEVQVSFPLKSPHSP